MNSNRLDSLGKYVAFKDIEKLTCEERIELKKQCFKGRSCYVADVGAFAQNIITDDGDFDTYLW